MWLNDWGKTQLEKALKDTSIKQTELSKVEWKLDLSFLLKYGVR
jgi:hypothetical protein